MSEFKEGSVVVITGNSNCHGFDIGQEVWLGTKDQDEQHVWKAFSKTDFWWVREEDMRPVDVSDNRLVQAKEMAYKFNTIVGSDVSYETLAQKLERVDEEVKETFEALGICVDNGCYDVRNELSLNKKELLDGVVDIAYTLFGLMQIAEQLGYDVFGALEAVCKNNDSKMCKTIEEANETAVMYEEQGIAVDIRYNEQYDVFAVVRNSDGKLLKCKGYKSVVLDQFLPKEGV